MSELEKSPEEQRQERLQQIDIELDQLDAQQREAKDREEQGRIEEAQAAIDEKKRERFKLMTDKERIAVFEDKLDDHREMAELGGVPVSIETIAEDAWGSSDIPETMSPYLQSEIQRIQQENDFIEGEE